MKHNKSLAVISLLSLSILTACGGGSATGDNHSPNSSNNPHNSNNSNALQPHDVSSENLQTLNVLSRVDVNAPVVTTTPDNITITYTSASGSLSGDHFQFYLNVDNDAATGFRFENEAWDKAGTDYIVEDGRLFKSTTNDYSWSWNENVGQVSYQKTDSSVSVTIKKSLLEGLKPTLRIGLMTRNADWDVSAIYPRSSLMAEYTLDITPPADSTAPVISLNGSSTLVIQQGSDFTDPGATAKDNVDGVLSDQIVTDSTVDTAQIGSYEISYSVTDNAGNTGTATRIVKVIAAVPDGIVIDGNNSDWADIADTSNSPAGIIKATNKNGKLYLMIDAPSIGENTQVFLDTDNDSATGFQFGGDIWNQGGADYMIENNHLDKAKVNSSAWSWDYNIGAIETARSGDIVEMAIPTNLLANLGSTINIGFVNRDAEWNVKSAVPETAMTAYTFNIVNPVYTPFANMPNITSIVKSNNKWYGISSSKKEILEDDGSSNIKTIFEHPLEVQTLSASIEGRLYFVVPTSLVYLDLETNTVKRVIQQPRVSILNGEMKDFLLVRSARIKVIRRSPVHFYRIRKVQKSGLTELTEEFRLYPASDDFTVESVDKVNNEINVIYTRGGNKSYKKVTSKIGVGLEDRQVYTPFANTDNVTNVVKANDKWFGISGNKILQDDGTNVSTIFSSTTPYPLSSLTAAITGKLHFILIKSKGSQCMCNSHGRGKLLELHSYDISSAQDSVLLSKFNVSIVNSSMKDFLLVSTRHGTPGSRQTHPTNYYKIDKEAKSIYVGKRYQGTRFSVASADTINNELHVIISNGSTSTPKKITSAVGIGLEDE